MKLLNLDMQSQMMNNLGVFFMKIKLSKINILLLTMLLGVAISFQIKNLNVKPEYVSLKAIHDYKKTIEKEKASIVSLKNLINDYKSKIQDYELAKNKDEDISHLLQSEIEESKAIAGLIDLQGPGIILIMNDGSRELYEGEDANNIIVHNVDVLNILNDLKVAGADAISVNGQRIISTTEIDCDGPTITINNRSYAQPFIIKAIGNPKQLESAIKAPGTYGSLLKEVGLFIEAYTSVNIEIPGYSEELYFNYMKVKEGE